MQLNIVVCHNLRRNSKGAVELRNPDTCSEVNLGLFSFTSALEIVFRETKVSKQLVLAIYVAYKRIGKKSFYK